MAFGLDPQLAHMRQVAFPQLLQVYAIVDVNDPSPHVVQELLDELATYARDQMCQEDVTGYLEAFMRQHRQISELGTRDMSQNK